MENATRLIIYLWPDTRDTHVCIGDNPVDILPKYPTIVLARNWTALCLRHVCSFKTTFIVVFFFLRHSTIFKSLLVRLTKWLKRWTRTERRRQTTTFFDAVTKTDLSIFIYLNTLLFVTFFCIYCDHLPPCTTCFRLTKRIWPKCVFTIKTKYIHIYFLFYLVKEIRVFFVGTIN